jgi:hypothetical protein
MLQESLNYLQNAGLFGKGALLVGLLLLIAGAVMITSRSTRLRFAAFLALALLPLALRVDRAAGPLGRHWPALRGQYPRHWRRRARALSRSRHDD